MKKDSEGINSFQNQREGLNNIGYWRKRSFNKSGKYLTQKELALLIGRSVSMTGRYERGQRRPTLEVLFLISATLRVPPQVLYPTLWEKCHEAVQKGYQELDLNYNPYEESRRS